MLQKVALVTNADQGIGPDLVKFLCKRFDGAVLYTSRNPEKGLLAVEEYRKLGYQLVYHELDISNRESIIRFRDFVQQNFSGIGTLINNVAINNGTHGSDSLEKAKKIITDYYFNYVMVQELLFPLLLNNAKVIYVSKESNLKHVKNKYWLERLSMQHLRESDINDFLVWYLESLKKGSDNNGEIMEDGTISHYRVCNVALTLLADLQRKELQSRSIAVNFLYRCRSVRTEAR